MVCIGGSALSGISTPLLKRAITRMEPLTITAGMHATAVVLLLPGALYDWPQARFTLQAVAAVALMGSTTSGLAYWMYMRIMRHVPPVAALSSTFMITGFGVMWAILFLDEATGPALYAGGALILVACMLVTGFNPLRRAESVAVAKP
jgi:drug/metabolite transporter (DMT)-like permease